LYFVSVSTLYVKATLHFPGRELLWLFREQTEGFNLHLSPKQNTLTGMFLEKELELAVKLFKASYTEAGRFLLNYNAPKSKEPSAEQNLRRDSA